MKKNKSGHLWTGEQWWRDTVYKCHIIRRLEGICFCFFAAQKNLYWRHLVSAKNISWSIGSIKEWNSIQDRGSRKSNNSVQSKDCHISMYTSSEVEKQDMKSQVREWGNKASWYFQTRELTLRMKSQNSEERIGRIITEQQLTEINSHWFDRKKEKN